MNNGQPKETLFQQYAALPYMVRDGELQILLVTSRQTHRWIIPKGWPMKGKKGPDVAASEAFEEAGLVGKIARKKIATFEYVKRIDALQKKLCKVDVYPLAVEQILDDWPEKGQRQREWMTPGQAAMRVTEAGLIQLMLDLTDYGETPDKPALSRKIRLW